MTKTLTVEVVEGDNIAPAIALNFTQGKAKVGAKPMLTVSATDNNGSVTLTKTWSDGAKITKPENPVKAPAATIRCEFVGWFYLGKEGNFDTDIVNYNINLQSKWKKVAIGGTSSNDSMVSNDSTQQGNQCDNEETSTGCGSAIGLIASTALIAAFTAIFFARRKNNNRRAVIYEEGCNLNNSML